MAGLSEDQVNGGFYGDIPARPFSAATGPHHPPGTLPQTGFPHSQTPDPVLRLKNLRNIWKQS
jgi:hypothetical protein